MYHRQVSEGKEMRKKIANHLIIEYGRHRKAGIKLDDLDDWHRQLWLHRADQILSHIREWGEERCTEHPEIFIGINYFFGNKIYIKPRRRECDQCWKELDNEH